MENGGVWGSMEGENQEGERRTLHVWGEGDGEKRSGGDEGCRRVKYNGVGRRLT